MKQRIGWLILIVCLVTAFSFTGGQVVSAADGDTVSLVPLFTDGTKRADYDVTDGGGQVLANGFVAGQAYTLTVNMTAASLTEPRLAITIPAHYELVFYTPANNATIAPYMAAKGVTNTVDGDGKRKLTYWFKDNTTAVGFTVTLRPTLKLIDGEIYNVTAELYGNGDEAAQATASSSVRVFNPAVHLGAFWSNGGYSQLTFVLNDPIQPVALGGYVYDYHHGRHAHHSMQVVLPLPVAATPGYYNAETFTPLLAGESREIVVNSVVAGAVTYLESYASTDANGNDITIPKVLLCALNNNHPLTQGTASSLSFNGLGGLYLQFPESTTTTDGNKSYQSTYTAQVSAKTDESSDYIMLLDHANGYSLYYVYQEYNISNFFYQQLRVGYDQYGSGSYLLPLEENQYIQNRFYNTTGYAVENIATEYSFDQPLYAHKLVFSLSSSADSSLPSAASVVYKTKHGGEVEYSASMSPEDNVLQLSDLTDAFTHLQVVYDKLGHSTGVMTLLQVYVVNREGLDTGTYDGRAQVISATCPTELVGTGTIGAQTRQDQRLLTRTYFESAYPYLSLDRATLNKGESFSVQVYPTYALPQQLTDLNIYILMPSEFVYSRLALASGYSGGTPVHSTRPLTVSPDAATAQVPAGDYTVHTFTFPGTFKSSTTAHRFYFEVGPLVDTATARTDVYLPAAVALSQSNDMFRYSTASNYRMQDIWDLDGDEDNTESLTTSTQRPKVTINAASALSAKSYLATSYTPGTEAATQSYQYNSTGSYKFILYNGLASGNNASDVSIDISVPRDNGSVTHDSTTCTSSWNAVLTGAPIFADSSGFLTGATASYSMDGGATYSTDDPADWNAVTNVRIVSAPGQSLADGENVIVTLPFRAGFEDDINLSSKAYFGNTMQYKLTSSGSLINAISIPPVVMQPANVAISGAVYQDLNGNLTKDSVENGNGTSYPVKLYKLAPDGAETLVTSTYSNASTGTYSFSVLHPGDYRIRVTKSAANQYFPLGTDDSFADDGTSTLNISGGVTGLSDLNLGILIPRTLTLNMSSAKVVDGTPQQIVPSVSSPLTELEAVTYASSDPAVVAVAADGTLTYVADGSVTITVSVPQLPAVVAAQGAEASDSVTATVSVVSQDDTCTISNDPYIGSTPSATKAEAINTASGTYPYSQTFYYFFNRSGYCNAAGHTYAEAVTWSISPTGTTAPGASITQNGANVTVSATGVGTVVLMAEETDDHKAATPLSLTVTIGKANIAGISFSDLRVTYDGNPHGITIGGTLPDGATVSYSSNTGVNAGEYNATATISGGANYNDLTLNATLTIDKANIAGVSFSSLTVPYDGTAKTLLLTGAPPVGTSAAYTNNSATSAGTYSASVTIDGGVNYNSRTLNATLVISKVQLTATVGNYSRVYGELNPAFTVSVSGFVNGETAATAAGYTAPTAGTTATAATGVGTAVITLSGGAATNYTFNTADTGLLSIQPKALTITADDLGKTYGSGHAFAGTELTSVGLVNGDRVTSANIGSTGAPSGATVGSYDININSAVGTGLGNYTITYVKGALTVGQKAITVTANNRSKTYGETLALGVAQFSTATGALVGSDSITGVTLISDGAGGTANAGSYDIIPSTAVGTGLSNYTISYAKGTLNVSPKALTITAHSASKTYGDALTFTGSEFTASGLVNGDQVTSVTLTSAGAAATAPAGSHDILPSAAVGPRLDNYSISYTKGTLNVGAKDLTITANSASKTYGDVIVFNGSEFATSGLANEDDVVSVTLTSAGAAATAAAGEHNITPSAAVGTSLENYSISYVKGVLTVGKKSITVTADSRSKTYGEELALGTSEFSTAAGALVGSDTITGVTLTSAGAGSAAAVGNYEVMPSAAIGTGLDNYQVSYVAGELSVGKQTLNITVSPYQSKVYGQPDPALTYLASGFTNGQDESILTGALTRVAGENVGSYAIEQATLSAGDNYSINFTGANFAITKAPLTVTADDKSKVYGAEDPVPTYTPSGALYHGDEYDVISGVTMNAPTGARVDVGEHEIAISGGEAANYSVTHVAGKLQVTPKTITAVDIAAASKYYDGTSKATLVTNRATLEGVLPEDDVTLDATAAVGTFDDARLGIGKVVSVTGLALTGDDAGNYVLATYTTTASIVEEEDEQKPPVSGVEIIVNGERHDAATASTTIEEGRTVTTVVVDPGKLSARLEAEGERAVVTIPVNTGAERVVGELTGQMVKEMEQAVATVQVATERAVYTLPAEQINIDAVADQLGEAVSLRDVKVQVQIAEPSPETVRVVEDQMNRGNYLLVVPPVEFSITCTYGDQTVEVSRFNAYVERQIAIPSGVEPSRVTTAVVVEADGTLRHVPTKVIVVDGKYYAQVNSLTNSTYTVIWNPLTYQDMVGHWAKGAVEDMGSRLVMTGDSAEVFGARRDITRGEFAITIVKALGLQPMNGESLFADVAADGELSGYALTAVQYGLMGGLPGGIFGPNQSITREEAMSIVVAAMRVSGVQNQLQPEEVEALLVGYADAAQVSFWARNVVADCLQSGLIGGRPGKLIAPKDNLTRAEAAAIVQRLLRRAGLI